MLSKEYWSQDFPRPLGPSDEDVTIFKDNMISGKTLLLGCTKKLLDLEISKMSYLNKSYGKINIHMKTNEKNTFYINNVILFC